MYTCIYIYVCVSILNVTVMALAVFGSIPKAQFAYLGLDWMYMYVCAFISMLDSKCRHVCMYVSMNMYVWVCVTYRWAWWKLCVYLHIYVRWVWPIVCVCVCKYASVCVSVCVCVCKYASVCVSVCVCKYASMHVDASHRQRCLIAYINILMYVYMYDHIYPIHHWASHIFIYISMYVYVRIYIYMYVYVCIYMFVCMHARSIHLIYPRHHVYMYVCMYICMYACSNIWFIIQGSMYMCVYVCMHACMHVAYTWSIQGTIYVCMYVCMNVCVCLYVCMYMYVCMQHGSDSLLNVIFMYLCVHACILYVCMHICMHAEFSWTSFERPIYVCIYVRI